MTAQAPEPAPLNAGRPGHVSEIVGAFRGVLAVAWANDRWTRAFDLTPGGFIRSFFGPAMALPLYVLSAGLVARAAAGSADVPTGEVVSAALAHVINAAGFPLIIALIARPLKIMPGYGAFIIVTNWAGLFVTGLVALASLLTLLGEEGMQAFIGASVFILCLWVFFTWRAARAALTRDIAPVLLVVVLAVAVDAGADKLGDLAAGALGFLITR